LFAAKKVEVEIFFLSWSEMQVLKNAVGSAETTYVIGCDLGAPLRVLITVKRRPAYIS
jgi:hypothetical protein